MVFKIGLQGRGILRWRRENGSLGVDGWTVEKSAERVEEDRGEEEGRGSCGCRGSRWLEGVRGRSLGWMVDDVVFVLVITWS